MLVRNNSNVIQRREKNAKLVQKRWTCPKRVERVIQKGLHSEVAMNGRQSYHRRVTTDASKRFHPRRGGLRRSISDQNAQYAWSADVSLAELLRAVTQL